MKLRKSVRTPLPALRRHVRARKLKSLSDYLENEWFNVVAVQRGAVVADGRLVIARHGAITGWPDVLAIAVAGVRLKLSRCGTAARLYLNGDVVDLYTSREAASAAIREWCIDNPD